MKHIALLIFTTFLSGCWLTTHTSKMPFGAMPLTVVAAGKDCSLARKLSGEGKYCMTELEIERANRPAWTAQKVYCYRSLAAPACYDRPSPNPRDALIGVYDRPVYPARID